VAETLWIRYLMDELGIILQAPVQVLSNNIFATYIAINLVLHGRSKHIKVDYHFVRERLFDGHLNVKYVPTRLQLVDIFTMSLLVSKFLFLIKSNLSVHLPV